MPIHLGRHPSKEGWIGFETDDHLTRTKARLYERCLPCLTGLYEQLKAGVGQVDLGPAWSCWKVTVVVADERECVAVLEQFGERFPDEEVYGKLGGGVGRETSAVVFHTESEERRDELAGLLSEVVSAAFPGRAVAVSRGCGNPYERLLGPWQGWRPVSPVVDGDTVAAVKGALRDSLYRRS